MTVFVNNKEYNVEEFEDLIPLLCQVGFKEIHAAHIADLATNFDLVFPDLGQVVISYRAAGKRVTISESF
jgi:hypothetical protein